MCGACGERRTRADESRGVRHPDRRVREVERSSAPAEKTRGPTKYFRERACRIGSPREDVAVIPVVAEHKGVR